MDLFFIKAVIVLLVSAIAAYTDWRSGYIYDWLTYPFILLGLIFSIIEGTYLIGLIIFTIVFVVGFLLYYTGKIGGGDIKLFAGFAFYFPLYNGIPHIIAILVLASAFALLYYGTSYLIFVVKTRPEKFLLGIILSLVAAIVVFICSLFNIYFAIIFSYLTFICILSLNFKDFIQNSFYRTEIQVKDLLDDDLADLIFLGKGDMYPLDSDLSAKIKEQKKPEDKITVYRNLPIFGPFIFLGTLASFYVLQLVPLLLWGI